MDPNRFQDGSRFGKNGRWKPNVSRRWPEMFQEAFQRGRRWLKRAEDGPITAQEEFNMGSVWAKISPRWTQERPKTGPRQAKMGPR